MGADEGILVADEGLEDLDSTGAATVLAAAVKKAGDVDLVLTGRQAVDWDTGVTGTLIGQILDAPVITFARSVSVGGGKVTVDREALAVSVRADESKRPAEALSEVALPRLVTALRRATSRLLKCSEYRHVRNEASRLDHSQTRERRRMLKRQAMNKPWTPPPNFAADASRLDALQKLVQAGADLRTILERLEDEAWLGELLEARTEAAAGGPV